MNTSTLQDARQVRSFAEREFTRIPGVHMVGVGLTQQDGGYAVKVNLGREAPSGALPAAVGGVPIVVEVVGVIS